MRVYRNFLAETVAAYEVSHGHADIGVVGVTFPPTTIVCRKADEELVTGLFPSARRIRSLPGDTVEYAIDDQKPEDVQATLEAYEPTS